MNTKYLPFIAVLFGFLMSCEPRIAFDRGQWGDRSSISGVSVVKYTDISNKLNYDEPVDGYQVVALAGTTTIDEKTSTINFVAEKGADLTKVAIRFTITADKMSPLEGAPVPGLINDFSAGTFKYRLFSANGATRDWTIKISVAP